MSAAKWIHVIPVIVICCLFVLWWSSVSGITDWDRVWVPCVYLFDFFNGFVFLGNWLFWFLCPFRLWEKITISGNGCFLGVNIELLLWFFWKSVLYCTCDSCVWLSGITNWDKVSLSCFPKLDFIDGFLFMLWFLVHWKQIAVRTNGIIFYFFDSFGNWYFCSVFKFYCLFPWKAIWTKIQAFGNCTLVYDLWCYNYKIVPFVFKKYIIFKLFYEFLLYPFFFVLLILLSGSWASICT